MVRSLVLSNGVLAANYDDAFWIRDLYYPTLSDNLSLGGYVRMGVWTDGKYSWLGPEWSVALSSEGSIASARAYSEGLGLELEIIDVIDPYEPLLIRRVLVHNRSNWSREARVFLACDLNLQHNDLDTAYYDDCERYVAQYNGARWFLANARAHGVTGVDHYTCSNEEERASKGAWRDCEDGALEGQPIAQGDVDFAIGANVQLEASSVNGVEFWLIGSRNLGDANRMNAFIKDRGPSFFFHRARSYDSALFASSAFEANMGKVLSALYRISIDVLRMHFDSGGAVIASLDSDAGAHVRDTYAYCWMRDGSLCARALDLAGMPEPSRDFFRFCARALDDAGYFYPKYRADGTPGPSWTRRLDALPALQLDETALVLWALGEHYVQYRDISLVVELRKMIENATEFLLEFRDHRGLPKPCYDLWEERVGVHNFTSCTVYSALSASKALLGILGEDTGMIEEEQHRLGQAIIDTFYDDKRGVFFRQQGDKTADASLLCMAFYGPLAVRPVVENTQVRERDDRLQRTVERVREKLTSRKVGGLYRYQGDKFQRVYDEESNPWIITTLWLARYYIRMGEFSEGMRLLEWVAGRATSTGMLPEQLHPETGGPISVVPLAWSHAEYAIALSELARAERGR